MASKVFADANLLLDLTLNRPGNTTATKLMQLAIEGSIQFYTTPAVIHITAYFTSQSFTHLQTKQIILTLLTDIQVIDCDHDTALSAVNSNMDDLEDALQYFTALKFKMDYFISSDKKLKKAAIPQLPVYTAAELLAEFEPGE